MPEFLSTTPEAEWNPSVQYSEGSRHGFQRDTQELIDRLTAKVQKDRSAIDDYILLGRLYRIRSNAARAMRLHRNLLVRPDLSRLTRSSLYSELGMDLLELRVQDFGESYFLQAIDLQKHNVSALEGLVRAYEIQNKFDLAAEHLKKLVRLGRPEKTHLAFVYAAFASRLLKGGIPARALRMTKRALKLDEKCLYAHLVHADIFTEAEKFEKATIILKATIQTWPLHSFLVLRRLEDVHYRMNAFPAYEHTLRDLIRLAPENFYLHYSLARHLRKKKRSSDALTALNRCLEIYPLYVNALRDRIELASDEKELKELKSHAARFFALLKKSRRFICPNCRHRYEAITWNCEKCGDWNTFEVRYEFPAP